MAWIGVRLMAVDESELIVLTRSLQSLKTALSDKTKKTDRLLEGFEKIMLLPDGVTSPIDADTNQTMTQARRDEIYDKCIDLVRELLRVSVVDGDMMESDDGEET